MRRCSHERRNGIKNYRIYYIFKLPRCGNDWVLLGEFMNKYVSGIRPSGKLHLGNYLGAIQHWKKLQDVEETYFFIADMHGQYTDEEVSTTQYALSRLGIGTDKQSGDRWKLLDLQHELSFHANTSRLDNMTQYKEKGGTLALYAYPVLMAAESFTTKLLMYLLETTRNSILSLLGSWHVKLEGKNRKLLCIQ